eukprot:1130702-Prorocentrum_minimum.AAC.1
MPRRTFPTNMRMPRGAFIIHMRAFIIHMRAFIIHMCAFIIHTRAPIIHTCVGKWRTLHDEVGVEVDDFVEARRQQRVQVDTHVVKGRAELRPHGPRDQRLRPPHTVGSVHRTGSVPPHAVGSVHRAGSVPPTPSDVFPAPSDGEARGSPRAQTGYPAVRPDSSKANLVRVTLPYVPSHLPLTRSG